MNIQIYYYFLKYMLYVFFANCNETKLLLYKGWGKG
jgi:hypothetical protein